MLANSTSPHPSFYPIYHFPRNNVLPPIPDPILAVAMPLVTYWVFSLLFHLIDCLEWPVFERYRIHEPEEVKTKNRVTIREVIWAVLGQQVIQTALGLFWLDEDNPSTGPFRDHSGDVERYLAWVKKGVLLLLGEGRGGEVVRRSGREVATWAYWWGVPILQFFFAA
jgi:sphinganine C4-monooxygenase